MIRGKTEQPFIKRWVIYPLQGALLLFFYSTLSLLPVAVAAKFSGKLFEVIGPLTSKQKVVLKNLKIAFPELGEDEKKILVKKIWRNIGYVFGESPHLEALLKTVRIEGWENVPKDENGKVRQSMFFSGHISNWELNATCLLFRGTSLSFIFREANNPIANWLLVRIRTRWGGELISKGSQGARQIIAALKNNRSIGMLVDQKMNDGISVPFFGKEAMTAPALATLGLKRGLPIIPMRVYREGVARYRVKIFPPLPILEDEAAMMALTNKMLEDWIRETPEQWLWIHNRWPKNNTININ